MSSQKGFDWLNISGLKSDSDLPPPPVSFGVSPIPSSTSLNDLHINGNSNSSFSTSRQSPVPAESTEPLEEYEDLIAPLSLTTNQLTPEEAKTYLRWYNDMVVRKGTTLIKLSDVFRFLCNFKLPQRTILLLEKIFKDIVSLNIGEFFAVLRVISHTLLGQTPRRRFTNIPAPTLKPRSILSRKRFQEDEEEQDLQLSNNNNNNINNNNGDSDSSKIDLDSFTRFMLTGERPSSSSSMGRRMEKKAKRVKFSDEVSVETESASTITTPALEPGRLDLSLPMDQLLQNLSKKHQAAATAPPQIRINNEDEELNEMKDSLNHFQNIKNVDSALIHGIPSQIPSIFFDETVNNMASPDLSPNPTGQATPALLAPNHTGPVPVIFNAYSAADRLSPNYTGSNNNNNNDQSNNVLSPTEQQPLVPAMTGSLSGGLRQQFHMGAPALEQQQQIQTSLQMGESSIMNGHSQAASPSPSFNNPILNYASNNGSRTPSPLPPPPPPSRRARSSSNPYSIQQQQHQQPPPPPPARNYGTPPPALPPKVPLDMNNQQTFQQPQQTFMPPITQQQQPQHPHYVSPSEFYQTMTNGGLNTGSGSNVSSTADILGDLKALQSEVERLKFTNGNAYR